MLIAMTAFAAVAAVSGVVGLGELATMAFAHLVLFVVPASLATLAFYSRGPRQTFFGGAFAGSLWVRYLHDDFSWGSSILESAVLTFWLTVAILSIGFTALYTRRLLERRGWHLPPSDDVG